MQQQSGARHEGQLRYEASIKQLQHDLPFGGTVGDLAGETNIVYLTGTPQHEVALLSLVRVDCRHLYVTEPFLHHMPSDQADLSAVHGYDANGCHVDVAPHHPLNRCIPLRR